MAHVRTFEPLPAVVDFHAERSPNAPAVLSAAESLSYGQLRQRADSLAGVLQRLGVMPDTIIGLGMPRGVDQVIAMLAILKAGAVCLPLDPDYPEDRLRLALEDSGAAFVLTSEQHDQIFKRLRTTIVIDSSVYGENKTGDQLPEERPRLSADQLAFLLYTSGSTGRPKGVLLEHQNITGRLSGIQGRLPLDSSDVMLHLFPFVFVGGITSLWWPLSVGAAVAIPSQLRDFDDIVNVMKRFGATVLRATPPLLETLLEHPLFTDCTPLKAIICTGQALNANLLTRIAQSRGARRFFNAYGQTEAGASSLMAEISLESTASTARIVLGEPVADTDIYVVDGDGKSAPVNSVGELCLAGVGVARGYLNQPGLTAEKFVTSALANGRPWQRVYRTGDLVRRRSNGEIEFCGRLDDQLKIRGYRVEPGEIESVLRETPGVSNAVVIAREYAPQRTMLVAYMVTAEAESQVRVDELRRQTRERAERVLPDYMVPAALVFVSKLPLGPTGKIDKQALPPPTRNEMVEAEHVSPRSIVEQQVAKSFEEVLNLPQNSVGALDDFFRLGGDSLSFARLIGRLGAVGLRIESSDLSSGGRTVAELAKNTVVTEAERNGTSTLRDERTVDLPLLSMQRQTLRALKSQQGKTISTLVRVPGGIDGKELDEGLQTLIRRHQALRSSIVWTGGEPIHQVRPYKYEPVLKLIDSSESGGSLHIEWLKSKCAVLNAEVDATAPFIAALFDCGKEQWLFLAVSTMFADTVSMQILLDELSLVLRQRALPPTLRYVDWIDACRWYAQSAAWEEERSFWESRLRRDKQFSVSPSMTRTDSRSPAQQVIVEGRLIQQLVELSTFSGISVQEMLLASYVRCIGRWCDEPQVPVRIATHGREVIRPGCEAVIQLVGCLTARFETSFGVADDPLTSLRLIREELARIPRRGVGMSIFRAFRPEWQESDVFLGAVTPIFNFEGSVDFAALGWDAVSLEDALLPGNERVLEVGTKLEDTAVQVSPETRAFAGPFSVRPVVLRNRDRLVLKIRFLSFSGMNLENILPTAMRDYVDDLSVMVKQLAGRPASREAVASAPKERATG